MGESLGITPRFLVTRSRSVRPYSIVSTKAFNVRYACVNKSERQSLYLTRQRVKQTLLITVSGGRTRGGYGVTGHDTVMFCGIIVQLCTLLHYAVHYSVDFSIKF